LPNDQFSAGDSTTEIGTSSARTPGFEPRRSTILRYIARFAATVLPGAQKTWICTRSSDRSTSRNAPYANSCERCSEIAMNLSPSLIATVSRIAS
jgi:hypothetical protein